MYEYIREIETKGGNTISCHFIFRNILHFKPFFVINLYILAQDLSNMKIN